MQQQCCVGQSALLRHIPRSSSCVVAYCRQQRASSPGVWKKSIPSCWLCPPMSSSFPLRIVQTFQSELKVLSPLKLVHVFGILLDSSIDRDHRSLPARVLTPSQGKGGVGLQGFRRDKIGLPVSIRLLSLTLSYLTSGGHGSGGGDDNGSWLFSSEVVVVGLLLNHLIRLDRNLRNHVNDDLFLSSSSLQLLTNQLLTKIIRLTCTPPESPFFINNATTTSTSTSSTSMTTTSSSHNDKILTKWILPSLLQVYLAYYAPHLVSDPRVLPSFPVSRFTLPEEWLSDNQPDHHQQHHHLLLEDQRGGRLVPHAAAAHALAAWHKVLPGLLLDQLHNHQTMIHSSCTTTTTPCKQQLPDDHDDNNMVFRLGSSTTKVTRVSTVDLQKSFEYVLRFVHGTTITTTTAAAAAADTTKSSRVGNSTTNWYEDPPVCHLMIQSSVITVDDLHVYLSLLSFTSFPNAFLSVQSGGPHITTDPAAPYYYDLALPLVLWHICLSSPVELLTSLRLPHLYLFLSSILHLPSTTSTAASLLSPPPDLRRFYIHIIGARLTAILHKRAATAGHFFSKSSISYLHRTIPLNNDVTGTHVSHHTTNGPTTTTTTTIPSCIPNPSLHSILEPPLLLPFESLSLLSTLILLSHFDVAPRRLNPTLIHALLTYIASTFHPICGLDYSPTKNTNLLPASSHQGDSPKPLPCSFSSPLLSILPIPSVSGYRSWIHDLPLSFLHLVVMLHLRSMPTNTALGQLVHGLLLTRLFGLKETLLDYTNKDLVELYAFVSLYLICNAPGELFPIALESPLFSYTMGTSTNLARGCLNCYKTVLMEKLGDYTEYTSSFHLHINLAHTLAERLGLTKQMEGDSAQAVLEEPLFANYHFHSSLSHRDLSLLYISTSLLYNHYLCLLSRLPVFVGNFSFPTQISSILDRFDAVGYGASVPQSSGGTWPMVSDLRRAALAGRLQRWQPGEGADKVELIPDDWETRLLSRIREIKPQVFHLCKWAMCIPLPTNWRITEKKQTYSDGRIHWHIFKLLNTAATSGGATSSTMEDSTTTSGICDRQQRRKDVTTTITPEEDAATSPVAHLGVTVPPRRRPASLSTLIEKDLFSVLELQLILFYSRLSLLEASDGGCPIRSGVSDADCVDLGLSSHTSFPVLSPGTACSAAAKRIIAVDSEWSVLNLVCEISNRQVVAIDSISKNSRRSCGGTTQPCPSLMTATTSLSSYYLLLLQLASTLILRYLPPADVQTHASIHQVAPTTTTTTTTTMQRNRFREKTGGQRNEDDTSQQNLYDQKVSFYVKKRYETLPISEQVRTALAMIRSAVCADWSSSSYANLASTTRQNNCTTGNNTISKRLSSAHDSSPLYRCTQTIQPVHKPDSVENPLKPCSSIDPIPCSLSRCSPSIPSSCLGVSASSVLGPCDESFCLSLCFFPDISLISSTSTSDIPFQRRSSPASAGTASVTTIDADAIRTSTFFSSSQSGHRQSGHRRSSSDFSAWERYPGPSMRS